MHGAIRAVVLLSCVGAWTALAAEPGERSGDQALTCKQIDREILRAYQGSPEELQDASEDIGAYGERRADTAEKDKAEGAKRVAAGTKISAAESMAEAAADMATGGLAGRNKVNVAEQMQRQDYERLKRRGEAEQAEAKSMAEKYAPMQGKVDTARLNRLDQLYAKKGCGG